MVIGVAMDLCTLGLQAMGQLDAWHFLAYQEKHPI